MADVLIRGMKMPESCDDCFIGYATDEADCQCYCMAAKKNVEDYWGYRPDWCPLVVVSPHGRLIDEDALREYWLENGQNEYVYDTNAFLDSLDDAPTVIEASEV